MEFLDDIKIRLLNVLRKVRSEGHTELVFGAWGSLDHAAKHGINMISNLFRDMLMGADGSGDVAGSFTKLTFAVNLDAEMLKVLRDRLQDLKLSLGSI